MSNFALVIGDDAKKTEEAMVSLRDNGYELYMASSHISLHGNATQAESFTAGNLKRLIKGIHERATDRDNVVIYITGNDNCTAGCISLQDECVSIDSFVRDIDSLHYRQRTVITDNYDINEWIPRLATDPKTEYIAVNDKDSDKFFHHFWNAESGKTDWEKFSAANEAAKPLQTTFMKGHDANLYPSDDMQKEFRPSVSKVDNKDVADGQVDSVRPGQIGVLDLFARWCNPCVKYKPAFEKLAQVYGGQYFFGLIEFEDGIDKTLADVFKVDGLPTVLLVDGKRNFHHVMNKKMPFIEAYALFNPDITREHLDYILERSTSSPVAASMLRYMAIKNPNIYSGEDMLRVIAAAEYYEDAAMALIELTKSRYVIFSQEHVDKLAILGKRRDSVALMCTALYERREDLQNYIIRRVRETANACSHNAWAYLVIATICPEKLTKDDIIQMINLSGDDNIVSALVDVIEKHAELFDSSHVRALTTIDSEDSNYIIRKLKEKRPELFS